MTPRTMTPRIESFFDETTFTVTHVVAEPDGPRAAVVDPVLDFDPRSGRTGTASADAVIAFVRERGLSVDWILETHAHADHVTAAPYLKAQLGGRIGIGARIAAVQDAFRPVFNLGSDFRVDGSQFDRLFADGDTFSTGGLEWRVMHTPGHTPACVTYLTGDAAFVGDTLFMPDFGTARCDFPGGDARALYRSMQRILALPDRTRLFLCHDYGGPPDAKRDYRWQTTVAEQRAHNVHIAGGKSEDAFVEMRTARDATLTMPALMLPAIQINLRAGVFPPPEENGVSYLKLPLNLM